MAKTNNAQPSTQPEVNYIKEVWVCAGQRADGDRVIQQWHEVTPKGLLGTLHYYKVFPRTQVGGVYEVSVERKDGHIIVVSTGASAPKFLRRWDDDGAVSQWTASEEAALAAKRRSSNAAKALEKRQAYKALDPFAEALALADSRIARAAVIATVIAYLENRASEIRADSHLLRMARRAMGGE